MTSASIALSLAVSTGRAMISWVADQSAKVAQQKVANSDALRGIKVRSTVPNSANVFATRLRCLACCGSPHGAGSDQDLDRRP